MSWIQNNWEAEYVVNAVTTIKDLVRLPYATYDKR